MASLSCAANSCTVNATKRKQSQDTPAGGGTMTLTIMGEDVTTQEAGSAPVTPQIRRDVTLGVVIGSRAFFNGAPCRQAREEVLGQLHALGVRALILPFEATHNGAVQSISDAQLYTD